MLLNRRMIRGLTILLCALALFGLVAGGCKKKGSSDLTFYEFFDPT